MSLRRLLASYHTLADQTHYTVRPRCCGSVVPGICVSDLLISRRTDLVRTRHWSAQLAVVVTFARWHSGRDHVLPRREGLQSLVRALGRRSVPRRLSGAKGLFRRKLLKNPKTPKPKKLPARPTAFWYDLVMCIPKSGQTRYRLWASPRLSAAVGFSPPRTTKNSN